MTRDTTMGKALLLLGPGADGKSKVISIMRALVGQGNCSAVTIAGLEDQFQRASLFRKMLNVGAELSAEATNSEFFKNVVTGDPIQASFKHKDSFEFRPYCKLAYAMNKKPRVLDNSDGFFRRILPVQFKRQFLEDDPAMDNELEGKLMAELDGIFAWAVLGLHRLMKNKRFTSCDETTEFIMKYRRYNNPVMAFVQDQCTLEDGYKPLNRENFIEELETATRKLREVAVKVYRPRVEGKRPQRVSGISLTSGFTNSL